MATQFLAVLAWSALGLFLGQVTKRYLPLALVYGLIVELGIGDIPTNINTLSLMRHLKTLLSHDQALQSLYQWTGTGFLLPVAALLLGAALFLGLAALLFTFRENHAAAKCKNKHTPPLPSPLAAVCDRRQTITQRPIRPIRPHPVPPIRPIRPIRPIPPSISGKKTCNSVKR